MRVGFIGAGLIATYHSKSIRRSGFEVERAGVYDLDASRAESFAAASGHRLCLHEHEVLDTCDAVYICTWTSEHRRLVEAAVDRGLAIFCEKPLATNVSDAEAMTDAVVKAGVTNQVGLILRWSPAFVMARHLVNETMVGPIMSVVFRDDQFIPTQGHYNSTWRGDVNKAGAGTLLEHSIHDVDMLEFLVGTVASVTAQSSNFHGVDGIEDVVAATVSFDNLAVGTLCSIWHDNLERPSRRAVEIFGANRYVRVDGDDWFGPVSWTDSGGSHVLEGDGLMAAAAAMTNGSINPDGAFLEAASSGQPATPDFSIALRAHQLVDAMYRSCASGGEPVKTPRF